MSTRDCRHFRSALPAPESIPRTLAVRRKEQVGCIRPDYEEWFGEVREALADMRVQVSAWQEHWKFDFRKEYERGFPAREAALHAHDYWWQQLLAESWT